MGGKIVAEPLAFRVMWRAGYACKRGRGCRGQTHKHSKVLSAKITPPSLTRSSAHPSASLHIRSVIPSGSRSRTLRTVRKCLRAALPFHVFCSGKQSLFRIRVYVLSHPPPPPAFHKFRQLKEAIADAEESLPELITVIPAGVGSQRSQDAVQAFLGKNLFEVSSALSRALSPFFSLSFPPFPVSRLSHLVLCYHPCIFYVLVIRWVPCTSSLVDGIPCRHADFSTSVGSLSLCGVACVLPPLFALSPCVACLYVVPT